jgi:hypothetical protein
VDDSITKILRPRKRAHVSAPPEAHSEYSRGPEPFRGLSVPRRRRARASLEPRGAGRPAGAGAVVLVALVGALLVFIAQFTALYHVHVATSSVPIKTVGTGANHGWAPVPIALACVVLAVPVYRYGNRAAMLGLAALGIATLLIALLGDLPDAHATGLIGSSANQYVQGAASPSAGLYLETLGAVLLLVSGGVGFLMVAPAPAAGRPPAATAGPLDEGEEDGDAPPGDVPPASKGPLNPRDSRRRKWSAS